MTTGPESAPDATGELLAAVADRWPGEPVSEVDRVARLLIAAWERAEGVTVSPSYVASFVEMAKVVVADTEVRVHAAREANGLTLCIHSP